MNINSFLPEKKKRNNTGAVALAFAAGTAVGAIIGLLLAPASGTDTRERLATKAGDLTGNLKDCWQKMKDRLTGSGEDESGNDDVQIDEGEGNQEQNAGSEQEERPVITPKEKAGNVVSHLKQSGREHGAS